LSEPLAERFHYILVLPVDWQATDGWFDDVCGCTLPGMDSQNLNRDQAEAIHDRLWPMMAHLLKLEDRMDGRDFPRDDKRYRLVKRAHDALHDVFFETHEMGCKGVGRRPK
jgi:hypothetical protein